MTSLKAKDMLLHSLAWRKQYQIDRLLTWQPPQILRDYFIAGWHHHDNCEWAGLVLQVCTMALTAAGRPVFIWRLGETDVKGLLKAGGESALLKYVSISIKLCILMLSLYCEILRSISYICAKRVLCMQL